MRISPDTVQQRVKLFLETQFVCRFGSDGIGTDDDLFELGVIDSFGLIELITFLEGEYGVRLSDEELLSPQLSTFNGITNLINSKLRGTP